VGALAGKLFAMQRIDLRLAIGGSRNTVEIQILAKVSVPIGQASTRYSQKDID